MLKKVFTALLLGCLVMGIVLPQVVLAQEEVPDSCTIRRNPKITGCPTSGDCPYTNELCGMCCLISTIYYTTDWLFTILITLVIIFVLWGGFEILMAAGAPEKISGGRNRIIYAAVGLAVALLARAVPAIVKYMIAPSS